MILSITQRGSNKVLFTSEKVKDVNREPNVTSTMEFHVITEIAQTG